MLGKCSLLPREHQIRNLMEYTWGPQGFSAKSMRRKGELWDGPGDTSAYAFRVLLLFSVSTASAPEHGRPELGTHPSSGHTRQLPGVPGPAA